MDNRLTCCFAFVAALLWLPLLLSEQRHRLMMTTSTLAIE